jgi:hypothetical protein
LDVESSKARAQVLTNTENIRHLNEKLEATKEPLREARANEQELLRIKPHLDFSQKQVASLTSDVASELLVLRLTQRRDPMVAVSLNRTVDT